MRTKKGVSFIFIEYVQRFARQENLDSRNKGQMGSDDGSGGKDNEAAAEGEESEGFLSSSDDDE